MGNENEVKLPLEYIVLPSPDDTQDFIKSCPQQLQHITSVALKIYNKHKLDKLIKFEKFLSLCIVMFLSGRITTLAEFEIASEQEGSDGITNIVNELTNELQEED